MAAIIIVDDSDALREVLAAVLAARGHDVTQAANGEAAKALFDQHSYDLAVFDIYMPDADGLALLTELRERGLTLPVVMMSGGRPGTPLEQAVAIADAYGADKVLFKPFGNQDLVDAVEALLAERA
ncbi:MAG: response regulator [Alphaproteobacteria bacterium]